MPITLPDFENGHFFWLMACGEVLSAGEEIVKWMKGERDKIAPIKTSRGTGYVRLMLGGHSGNHVRFDVIAPELASKRLKSEAKSTLGDIQASADRLRGKEVEVNLKGGFQANLQELPESGIVRSLLFQTKIGKVAIKLDGAILSIEGAPVQNISWQAGSKGNIKIDLEARSIKTLLSENYLTSAIATLEQAFNIFVLGKIQNEPK